RLLHQLLNQPRQSHRLQHVVSRTSEESTSPPSLELVAAESYPSQTSSLPVRELSAPRLLRAHQRHPRAAAETVPRPASARRARRCRRAASASPKICCSHSTRQHT